MRGKTAFMTEPDSAATRATSAARDVMFFVRGVPCSEGWSWRLFARTGATGRPKVVYAARHVYPTQEEALRRGREAIAAAALDDAILRLSPRAA